MKEQARSLTEYCFYLTRERLFDSILLRQKRFIFLEFGVSEGKLTEYFFRKYKSRIDSYHGFDTFMGLPEAWGDLPAGTFSTDGKTPKINSTKVYWHVGRVEDAGQEIFRITNTKSLPKIFIFDLDLYGPSKSVWLAIKKNLNSGDILYFDEAYYYDERNLVEEILLDVGPSIQILGFTIFGVAYEIL